MLRRAGTLPTWEQIVLWTIVMEQALPGRHGESCSCRVLQRVKVREKEDLFLVAQK